VHKRNLIITGVLAVGAAVVMMTEHRGTKSEDSRLRQPLLTAEQFATVEKIAISQGERTIKIERTGEGHWQVAPQVEGQTVFPADAKQIATLVDSLSRIKVQELLASKKTSWGGMGLDAPKVLTLTGKDKDQDKEILAANFGDTRKTGGQFVSFGTEEKAYLLAEAIQVNLDAAHWELKTLINIKPENVKSITFQPAETKSKPAKIAREKAEDPLKLEMGKDSADAKVVEASVTSAGALLSDLAFVKRHDPSNEEAKTAMLKPSRITVELFDGRTVQGRIGKLEGAEAKHFVHLEVSPGQSTAKLDDASTQLNQLMGTFAFEVAGWMAERMTRSYADFIEKPAAAPASSVKLQTKPKAGPY